MAEPIEHLRHHVSVEIGCGDAARSVSAPAELNVGVDLNISALPTTAHSPKGWAFICADALALPFRDHSCTDLRIQAVLHHLVPTAHALSELTRVLRPSGLLTIVDGVALSSREAAHLDHELQQGGHPGEPTYGFELSELTALIRASGLEIESIHTEGTATWATPPFVSKPYTSDRFHLTASHP